MQSCGRGVFGRVSSVPETIRAARPRSSLERRGPSRCREKERQAYGTAGTVESNSHLSYGGFYSVRRVMNLYGELCFLKGTILDVTFGTGRGGKQVTPQNMLFS